MNTIDWIAIGLLALTFFLGFKRGFIRELASLAGVWVALFVAVKGSKAIVPKVIDVFSIHPLWAKYVAFALLFLVVLVGIRLGARLLSKAINFTPLGPFDKTAGGLLGLVKACLFISLVGWIAKEIQYKPISSHTENSAIIPVINKGVAAIAPFAENYLSNVQKEILSSENEENRTDED